VPHTDLAKESPPGAAVPHAELAKESPPGAAVPHCEVLCADLTNDADLARVEERIRALPQLDCLINNAGCLEPERFVDADAGVWESMVKLHCVATVRLTRAALPGMIARKRGDVINVSSVAAFVALPRSIVYSSTKAFLNNFTEGLAVELHGTGVRVQALCPGWTRTELVFRPGVDTSRIPTWWLDSPEFVVDCSMRCLDRGKVICIVNWKNRLLVRLTKLMPRPLLRALVRRMRSGQVERKNG